MTDPDPLPPSLTTPLPATAASYSPDRLALAQRALDLYAPTPSPTSPSSPSSPSPPTHTIREVSLLLGVSYGKARALILLADPHAIRPRGTRSSPIPPPPRTPDASLPPPLPRPAGSPPT